MKTVRAVLAELSRLDPDLFVSPYEGEGGGTIMVSAGGDGKVVAQIECGYETDRLDAKPEDGR